MDGTLLSGRLVFALAKGLGADDQIKSIQDGPLSGHEKTKQIAALFAGVSKKTSSLQSNRYRLQKTASRQ